MRGQGSLLLETALHVTLEQLSGATGSLPVPHHSFLPTSQPQLYWKQLAEVYGEPFITSWGHRMCTSFCSICMVAFSGDPGFYSRVLSLCRALSQYLLTVNQLPSSLRIPSDKEHLITTFTCAATEVRFPLFRLSKLNHRFCFSSPWFLLWSRWLCGISFRTSCPWVWTCSGLSPVCVWPCNSPVSGTNYQPQSTTRTPAPSFTAYITSFWRVRTSGWACVKWDQMFYLLF